MHTRTRFADASGASGIASPPPTIAPRMAPTRVSDIARFAARVNQLLKVEIDRDVIVVTPGSNVGALRYQEIHLEVGRINDLIRHGGFQNLVVDLGACQGIENVILTALVGFCRSIPGAAAFCSVSEENQQLMRNANLLGLWPLYASRSDAVDALTSLSPSRED